MTTPSLLASGAAILAGVAVLACSRPPALAVALPPVPFAATVLSIGDGDTLRVIDASGQRVTIRLACIDAPESKQPGGAQARAFLAALAPIGSAVTVRPHSTDRYRRMVAEAGAVNWAMVAGGHAFAYRRYLTRCDRRHYLAAEGAAQRERLGLWATPGGGVRPWDWRKGVR